MDQRTLDLEESRRILLGSDDEGDIKPDEGKSLSDDENNEKDQIVKLSSYTFNINENKDYENPGFSNSDHKSGIDSGLSPGKSLTRGVSYQPSLMEDDGDDFGVGDGDKADALDKDEESDGDFEPSKRARPGRGFSSSQYPDDDEDDNDDDDEEEEE